MKKLSIIKNCLLTAFLAVSFSGCINSDMIKISKTKDGSTQYKMYSRISPDIQHFKEYNGWNVHDYSMDVSAVDDKVKIELEHKIGFTVGSGTPSANYVKKYLYHGINDFEIIGLKSEGDATTSDNKALIFDWWYETVSRTYSKKAFIDFVLKNDIAKMKISSSRYKIKSKNGSRDMKILGMHNLKKFALCLENNATCIEKK